MKIHGSIRSIALLSLLLGFALDIAAVDLHYTVRYRNNSGTAIAVKAQTLAPGSSTWVNLPYFPVSSVSSTVIPNYIETGVEYSSAPGTLVRVWYAPVGETQWENGSTARLMTTETDGSTAFSVATDHSQTSVFENVIVKVDTANAISEAAEHDSGCCGPTVDGYIHVARIGSTNYNLFVTYAMSGTADRSRGADYALVDEWNFILGFTQFKIASGHSSAIIRVAVNNGDADNSVPAETAIFTMQSGSGYTLESPYIYTVYIYEVLP
jgi:hypothetical protein